MGAIFKRIWWYSKNLLQEEAVLTFLNSLCNDDLKPHCFHNIGFYDLGHLKKKIIFSRVCDAATRHILNKKETQKQACFFKDGYKKTYLRTKPIKENINPNKPIGSALAMTGRKRERRGRVFVILEGNKTCRKKPGIAPLKWALRDVVNPRDDLLLLIILNPKTADASPDAGICCMWDHGQGLRGRGDQHIKFLHQQISRRRETYLQILRPFYDRCKICGVKVMAKVAAGVEPKGIMLEAAKNSKTTWIVMDRCFAKYLGHPLTGVGCNVALVNDDEEAVIHNHLPFHDDSNTSIDTEAKPSPESPKPADVHLTEEEQHIHCRLPNFDGEPRIFLPSIVNAKFHDGNPSTLEALTKQNENPAKVEPSKRSSEANDILRIPLKLSWEEIVKVTDGFPEAGCISQSENFFMYLGNLYDTHVHVMFSRSIGYYSGIIERERRVALSIFHQNIARLICYHESENYVALVYPYAENGTLDQYICDWRREDLGLTFRDRMKIAIEIARGVRCMHEECLHSPVAHGDLRPSNIFLRHDFQPQISGFGKAVWLQLDQAVPNQSDDRCWHKDPTDPDSIALIKSDVLSFGVLLLRLFCGRSLPRDDHKLIELARPLLLNGAFHELLDQDMEDSDMYEIYKVMCAATQCTETVPLARPGMSQVVSILRGDKLCSMQMSPLLDCSGEKGDPR